MKRISFSMAALLCSAIAAQAVPNTLNYQGQLFLNNSPAAGPVDITFRMFTTPTGGTALWTETDNGVTVTAGLFSTTLGDNTPFPANLFTAQVPWLEIEVNGQTLTPRAQFHSVPYARSAGEVGGSASWDTDGTHVWRANGNVGIGTSSPTQPLQIETASGSAALLMRSYVPGTGPYASLRFQNTLATEQGVAAEIAALRPVATWGQESDLLFSTNPGSPAPALAERLRITKEGNVGIGTSSPQDKLEVAGNLTLGPYDAALGDVVLRAAGGCPNCGTNSMAGAHLVLRSGIGTGAGQSGDIVFQVGDGLNYGNQQPRAVVEAMRIHTTSRNVSISGNLDVAGTKCRIVDTPEYGKLFFNATEDARPLFTDSGQSQLQDGRATVELDRKWLAGVTIDATHPMRVWISFSDDPGGWHHVRKGTTQFTVIGPTGSTARFDWKVEARQRGYEDIYLDRSDPVASRWQEAR